MLRYSLRTLIAAVSVVGVACAALLNAAPWIASTAWTLAWLVLALATVAAVLGAPARRGFWTGFAILGWTYLFVSMGPMDAGFRGTLWTTAILQKASAAAPQSVVNVQQPVFTTYTITTAPNGISARPQMSAPPPPPPVPTTTYSPSPQLARLTLRGLNVPNENFVQAFQHIGQALWTMLFAFIGGLFGASLVARNNRPAPAIIEVPS